MNALGRFRVGALAVGAAAMLLAATAGPAAAATKTLVVEAGTGARAHVPMSIEAPEGTASARMTEGGRDVPCQVTDGRLWWILDALPAGATRTYTVDLDKRRPADADTPDAAGHGVKLHQTPKTVEIAIDGQPFTTYEFSNPKHAGQQLRRPYFFPVFGPGRTTMTRPYPLTDGEIPANVEKDHPHHTSIWVAHGDVNETDNWSIAEKAGWQVHKAFETVAGGPVVGLFRETLDWTDAQRKPVMAEVRTVRVYRLPDAARMLDMDLTFRATAGKVVFGDTKEGGLCATRMRTELQADAKGSQGRLVNSEAQAADDAWGKKALWVDCSGLVDGKRIGYAIFDAPGNLRHPATWHARTYGLVTANPFGLNAFDKNAEKGNFTLEAGKEMTQRYRLYFHAGDEKEARVAERFADFADPPKATWK